MAEGRSKSVETQKQQQRDRDEHEKRASGGGSYGGEKPESGEDSTLWAGWLFRKPSGKTEQTTDAPHGGLSSTTQGTLNGGRRKDAEGMVAEARPHSSPLQVTPLDIGSSLGHEGYKGTEYGGTRYGVNIHNTREGHHREKKGGREEQPIVW